MRQLARDRRGVAAIEFGVMLPFLCVALVGFLDIVYIGRGHLRVQAAATQVGQIISQCKSVGGGDEAQLVALAKRTLSPLADTGRPWAVIVTAIRPDSKGKPSEKWRMDNRADQAAANPRFATKGTALPTDFTLKADQIIFRTEVFAEIDATLFAGDNNVLAAFMRKQLHIGNARSSVLHMGRSPNADALNTKTSAEACLS